MLNQFAEKIPSKHMALVVIQPPNNTEPFRILGSVKEEGGNNASRKDLEQLKSYLNSHLCVSQNPVKVWFVRSNLFQFQPARGVTMRPGSRRYC